MTANNNNVGPVLIAGILCNQIIAAIKQLNEHVAVQSYGSYCRVSVPFKCHLTKEAIEAQTGTPFVFPDDLELVMPSFKGIFTVSQQEALWLLRPKTEDKF